MTDYEKIKAYYQNGGSVGFLEDGTILYTVNREVLTLDKTQKDFFGDRTMEEVMGTEEYELMNLYIAEKWIAQTGYTPSPK